MGFYWHSRNVRMGAYMEMGRWGEVKEAGDVNNDPIVKRYPELGTLRW